jgi:hypothetical protein
LWNNIPVFDLSGRFAITVRLRQLCMKKRDSQLWIIPMGIEKYHAIEIQRFL